MNRTLVHLFTPTLMAICICLLGASVGAWLAVPAAHCLAATTQLEQSLDAYPYGCYGELRYDALQQNAPSCIPDVVRQAKGDRK